MVRTLTNLRINDIKFNANKNINHFGKLKCNLEQHSTYEPPKLHLWENDSPKFGGWSLANSCALWVAYCWDQQLIVNIKKFYHSRCIKACDMPYYFYSSMINLLICVIITLGYKFAVILFCMLWQNILLAYLN